MAALLVAEEPAVGQPQLIGQLPAQLWVCLLAALVVQLLRKQAACCQTDVGWRVEPNCWKGTPNRLLLPELYAARRGERRCNRVIVSDGISVDGAATELWTIAQRQDSRLICAQALRVCGDGKHHR